MKLLLDATNIAPGGGLIVLGNILRQWRELGVDIDVTAVASRKITADGLREYRDDIEILPFMQGQSPTKVFLGRRFVLGKQIEKLSPDMVFAGNYMVGRCGVPQHVHHQNLRCLMDWPFFENFSKYGLKETMRCRKQRSECIHTLKNARSNSFISDYMRLLANELVPGSAGRNHTVHNASAVELNKDYTFNENPPATIAAIQTSDEHKNNPTLIRTLAGCVELCSHADWRLKIIGNGDWSEVADIARKLGVINRVAFMNYCSPQKISQILDSAFCLVFPSRCEGFGIPPLDAMSRGCAVVSSNVDALPEVIGNGGIMLDPDDAEGFASAVVKLYTNPQTRKKMVDSGFERAKTFSWQTSAEKLANILLS